MYASYKFGIYFIWRAGRHIQLMDDRCQKIIHNNQTYWVVIILIGMNNNLDA